MRRLAWLWLTLPAIGCGGEFVLLDGTGPGGASSTSATSSEGGGTTTTGSGGGTASTSTSTSDTTTSSMTTSSMTTSSMTTSSTTTSSTTTSSTTTSSTTTSSTTTSSTTTTSTTITGDCNPPCIGGLECCNGLCVNKGNDIKNCGKCGHSCEGGFPFCANGKCEQAPCEDVTCFGNQNCCGSQCCDLGKLCCVVQQGGPIGPPTCYVPNQQGTCPPGCPGCQCAAPDTPIATPSGDRAIAGLREGDLVYSVHRGRVQAVPLAAVKRVAVSHHRVVRIVLDSGRTLLISAVHPTADGRTIGDLSPGQMLSGARVVAVELVPYRQPYTHDIQPASDTGTYFAGGALVGSTMHGPADVRACLRAP